MVVDEMAVEMERSDIRYIQEKAALVGMTTAEYLLYMILDELENLRG